MVSLEEVLRAEAALSASAVDAESAAKRHKPDTSTNDTKPDTSAPEFVLCSFCQTWVPKDKCQANSKCNICNSKLVELNRQMGGWPTPDFKALSADEKAKFYQEIKSIKAAKGGLQKYVKERFQKKRPITMTNLRRSNTCLSACGK